MEKIQMPIIILAIFSMSILLMFDYFTKPAYAVSAVNVSIGDPVGTFTTTISSVSYFITVDELDGDWQRIRASDAVVVSSGSIDAVCEAGGRTCTYKSIACSGSTCYINADSTVTDSITRVDVVTGVASRVYDYGETSVSPSIVLHSGKIIASYTNGANEKIRQIDTADFTTVVDSADLNVPTPKVLAVQTIGSFQYAVLGGSTLLDIFNLSTNSVTCQSGTVDNWLDAVRHLSDWWITSDDGVVRQITNGCVTSSTITASTLGCTGGVTQSIANDGINTLFIACDIASAGNKIVNYNTTSSSVIATYGCGGNSVWNDNMQQVVSYSSSADSIACSMSDLNLNRIIFQQGTGGAIGGSTVCIDTTGDTVTDICFTDTNGDGVPDAGAGGALAVYRGTANVTKFGADLGCAFGMTSCTNLDIKTNGIGLFYLMLIIIFSYAFLVFIHFQAKKIASAGNVHLTEVLNINPILLVIMLFVDVGMVWKLGWIQDEIFYTALIGVIGIASFGLYRHFRGD